MTPKIRLLYYVGLGKRLAVPIKDIRALIELRDYLGHDKKWFNKNVDIGDFMRKVAKDLKNDGSI